MSTEFTSKYPSLLSDVLSRKIHRGNFEVNAGTFSPEEIERAFRIVDCARKIAPAVCDLPENQGKAGFVMAITKRPKESPVLTVQIGTVKDSDPLYGEDGKLGKYCIFAALKAKVLQDHARFISSSQNLSLPEKERVRSEAGQEIPGGAIAFSDWIISVSAFKNPNMDTATTLAIAAGAGLVGIDEVEEIALDPRVNCREFMIYEDEIFVIPILH